MSDLEMKYRQHSLTITGPCTKLPSGSGVYCDTEARCEVCGWNPAVSDSRRMTIRDKGIQRQKPRKPKEPREKWWIGRGPFPNGWNGKLS